MLLLNRLVFAIATVIAASSLSAQPAAQPFTASDLVRLKRLSDPQVSPDGRYVAFVLSETDLDANKRPTDLWLIDLETGAERQLTSLPPGFTIRDFDVSRDGREVVLERVEDHSDVVLIDRTPPG